MLWQFQPGMLSRAAIDGVAASSLSISGTPITTTVEDVAYAGFTVTAADGTAPYTYSVASGTLPTGITLNSSSGLVSGTPTTPGVNASIVIRATDAVSATADLAPFTLTVTAAATATWDPATVTSVTLSGGNLLATNTGTTSTNQGAKVATSAGKTTGKHYFEVTWTDVVAGNNLGFGIGTTSSTYSGMGGSATTGIMIFRAGSVYVNGGPTAINLGSWTDGQVTGAAVDLDARKLWFRWTAEPDNWNSPDPGSNSPVTGVGGLTIPAGTIIPFVIFGGTSGAANNKMTANFGATAFVAAAPSGYASGWTV